MESVTLRNFSAPSRSSCWRSLERQFAYRNRTDRVAFPLEYSPKVYQSTEQAFYIEWLSVK